MRLRSAASSKLIYSRKVLALRIGSRHLRSPVITCQLKRRPAGECGCGRLVNAKLSRNGPGKRENPVPVPPDGESGCAKECESDQLRNQSSQLSPISDQCYWKLDTREIVTFCIHKR